MLPCFPSPLKNAFLLSTIFASLVTISNAARIGSFETSHPRRHEYEEVGLEMVEKSGSQFAVRGQPFYVNGFNTYWLMALAVDPSTRGKVTQTFADAASVGLTVARTWAFNDGGWQALQKSPSVYDENVFKALDFVVSEAKQHNIRLLLTLTNNWNDYGGKAQYVQWGKAAGLNLASDDDFFSDPTVKGYYKDYIKTILNRVNTLTSITYKDDPTIFGWELINEPRCKTDPSGNKLQSWIEEMASYVKSIDSNHLLAVGLEGFYGPSTPNRLQFNPNNYTVNEGTDFIRNQLAPGIDFATAHIYPDTWISNSISDYHLQFTNSWMQSHIDDAVNALKMPMMFTEFGVSSKDNNFSVSFRDQFINLIYNKILDATSKGGSAVGGLLWQIFPEGTDNMDDGYAVVLSKSKSTSDIITLQSKKMQMASQGVH